MTNNKRNLQADPSVIPDDAPDVFVPEAAFCEEIGIVKMTARRNDRNPKMATLNWPKAIRSNGGRVYRTRREIEKYKRTLIELASKNREALLRAAERKAARQSA
jgi:hypothetical protein